jgi:ComF family protein
LSYHSKKAYLDTLLEIFFPGKCLLCGEMLLGRSQSLKPVCLSCLEGLIPITGRRCRVCSRVLISEKDICTTCRQREYNFNTNYAIFEYSGVIKELIYQYKFRRRKRVALIFAGFLSEVLQRLYPRSIVIPVPPRKQPWGQRDWEHVDLITRCLEGFYGITAARILKRSGKKAQKSMDFRQREENIRNTISLKGNLANTYSNVVLLDDIFTTGATGNECARILRAAGCQSINLVTLALDY